MGDPDPDETPELRAAVVRYASGPDRVTLHPETDDDVALTATWLSADLDRLRSLEEWR
jgi:hypothetical protein